MKIATAMSLTIPELEMIRDLLRTHATKLHNLRHNCYTFQQEVNYDIQIEDTLTLERRIDFCLNKAYEYTHNDLEGIDYAMNQQGQEDY